MMTTLPAALQEDWALELMGGIIKYAVFARELFVGLASSLKPDYPVEHLADVLLETVIRAATSAAPGIKDSQRRRAQMAALDAKRVFAVVSVCRAPCRSWVF